MNKFTIAAALALLTLPAWAQEEHGRPELATTEPPMLGLHMARGAQPQARTNNAGPGGSNANLIYHGGPMATGTAGTVVQPIYWGPKWNLSAFKGDKIDGLTDFYSQVGGSTYAGTNTEYRDVNNFPVSDRVSWNGDFLDYSSTPSKAPSTSTVLAKVCQRITNPVTNGYYPVYTDVRRGTAGYCAWHSWGTCGGVQVQFGFFFDLDGDAGCDPRDSRAAGPSQGLAALVNVSGHELSEEMTDPRGTGMYDRQGYENSDKCAWDFGPTLIQIGSSQWKIQGNWSNAAYNSNADSDPFNNRGYANEKGQKGCIDGGSFR
jgi:hypothetical protein